MSSTGNCSCGGCGCGSCSPNCVIITIPGDPSGAYSLENVNLIGVGVADSQDGNVFNFRGVASANSSLSVTYDPSNHAIILTLNIEEIVNDIPDATTTQRGVLETATDAEAIAKIATNKIVTPSNFAAMGSSTTFAGFVELATNAETQAGISTTLAVTPAGLASVIALQQGTEVWADAVARAAADPDFAGQIGVQLDTDVIFIATTATVGGFTMPAFMLGNGLNQLPANTGVDLNGFILTFTGPSSIEFASLDFQHQGGVAQFNNGIIHFGDNASEDVDFGAQARVQSAGVLLPADSVFITTGTAGELSSALINTFVSNANVQTYGLPSGTVARTTFATYAGQNISNPPTEAEVQAIDDALVIVSRRLGALITDLMATLKPHA